MARLQYLLFLFVVFVGLASAGKSPGLPLISTHTDDPKRPRLSASAPASRTAPSSPSARSIKTTTRTPSSGATSPPSSSSPRIFPSTTRSRPAPRRHHARRAQRPSASRRASASARRPRRMTSSPCAFSATATRIGSSSGPLSSARWACLAGPCFGGSSSGGGRGRTAWAILSMHQWPAA